ncbi:hypothetical protein MUP77_04295 [Candidatus Bathyarchaeota archaeon]|nr:hypothetical protein [Candidatus Bathyarchaeota archaeon]
MSRRDRRRPRKVDEGVPLRVRNIEEELPKPIGIHAENLSNSLITNCTFVGVPTPIFIRRGKNNVFWNNRVYPGNRVVR